jgi:hypothetical protein
MRKLALCGLILLCLAACGSGDPGGSTPATHATTVTVAGTSTSAASSQGTSASVVKARATISPDGLEFVGADAIKVGNTLQIDVTNQGSGPVEVSLLNPGGTAVSHTQISAGGTGQITGTIDATGDWTFAFTDQAGTLTKKISVH